ncbi:MAG: urea ABC transporter permease subunit UrtB, partial [Marinospirillum sp.]|nr:urea ABC transporter permease subunit UrtB [Marinospirillum sp.]
MPLLLMLLLLLWLPLAQAEAVQPPAAEPETQAQQLLEALDVASFQDKGSAILQIVASEDPRARNWLSALLEGNLQRERSGRFVLVEGTSGRDLLVSDALSGEALGAINRRDLSRISINNPLRNQLRSALALIDLYSSDLNLRRASAERLIG